MPSRARVPIRTRVNLAFALAVGVLLAIAAASYQSVTSLAETGQWIGHTHEVLAAIDAVAAATTAADAGTRGYALTGEERFLEAYQSGARGAEAALAALRRLTADNLAEQGRADRLEPLLREHLARLADTVAIRRERGGAAAAERVKAASRTGLVESIHAVIEEMRAAERKLLAARAAASDSRAARTRWIIVIGSLAVVVVTVLSSRLISREIERRREIDRGLRASEARYRLLVDRNLAAIARTRRDGAVLECNDAMVRLLGCASREEVLGMSASQFYADPARPRAARVGLRPRRRRGGPGGALSPEGRQRDLGVHDLPRVRGRRAAVLRGGDARHHGPEGHQRADRGAQRDAGPAEPGPGRGQPGARCLQLLHLPRPAGAAARDAGLLGGAARGLRRAARRHRPRLRATDRGGQPAYGRADPGPARLQPAGPRRGQPGRGEPRDGGGRGLRHARDGAEGSRRRDRDRAAARARAGPPGRARADRDQSPDQRGQVHAARYAAARARPERARGWAGAAVGGGQRHRHRAAAPRAHLPRRSSGCTAPSSTRAPGSGWPSSRRARGGSEDGPGSSPSPTRAAGSGSSWRKRTGRRHERRAPTRSCSSRTRPTTLCSSSAPSARPTWPTRSSSSATGRTRSRT